MACSTGVFTPSLFTTAFLSMKDGNTHQPLPSTKLFPPPDLKHAMHISNLTAGTFLGTSYFRTSGCSEGRREAETDTTQLYRWRDPGRKGGDPQRVFVNLKLLT